MQVVSDANGHVTAVLVPIRVGREVEAELETQHLLGSATMRQRLLRAREDGSAVPLHEVARRFDLDADAA